MKFNIKINLVNPNMFTLINMYTICIDVFIDS